MDFLSHKEILSAGLLQSEFYVEHKFLFHGISTVLALLASHLQQSL